MRRHNVLFCNFLFIFWLNHTRTPLEFKLVTSCDFTGEEWQKRFFVHFVGPIKRQVIFDTKLYRTHSHNAHVIPLYVYLVIFDLFACKSPIKLRTFHFIGAIFIWNKWNRFMKHSEKTTSIRVTNTYVRLYHIRSMKIKTLCPRRQHLTLTRLYRIYMNQLFRNKLSFLQLIGKHSYQASSTNFRLMFCPTPCFCRKYCKRREKNISWKMLWTDGHEMDHSQFRKSKVKRNTIHSFGSQNGYVT